MKKVKLEVLGLSFSQTQSGAYAVVLSETDGFRRLPIIIGGFEAQAITIHLEGIKTTRPITHDLFKSFAGVYDIKVEEIIIYKLQEGIFYAKLICNQNGDIQEIDARTSDAIAIGIRFNAPIYTYESIISSAGIKLEDTEDTPSPERTTEVNESEELTSNEITLTTIAELEEQLKNAIENEDYELASKLRDEINRRTS